LKSAGTRKSLQIRNHTPRIGLQLKIQKNQKFCGKKMEKSVYEADNGFGHRSLREIDRTESSSLK
jgi:hypothetical protein